MSDWIIWFGEVVFFLAISLWGIHRVLYGRRRPRPEPGWHHIEPSPLNPTDQPKDERTW